MLNPIVPFLFCPVCQSDMHMAGNSLRCTSGHSFDIARQGYVNLLAGHAPPGTADTTEMVQARDTFLGAGHFRPLADRLAEWARHLAEDGLVIDAGAGTGYYLHAVLERLPSASGLALDISKFALRRAAQSHPRAGAVVWDVWRTLPVKTHSAALLLNIFAPRNAAEFRRVLRPEGALLVVTPTKRHLAELVQALGLITVDERKDQRLDETLASHFALQERSELTMEPSLTRDEVETLVRMGPSARHLDSTTLAARTAGLAEPTGVTASFTLSIFRPLAD